MTSNDSGASIYAKNELAKRRYEARVRARRRLCPHLSKTAHSTNGADGSKNGVANTANSNTKDTVSGVSSDTKSVSGVAKGNPNSIAKGSADTTNSPTNTAASDTKGTAENAAKGANPTKTPYTLENPRRSKGELCPALAKFELLLWDRLFFYEKCLLDYEKCLLDGDYKSYNPRAWLDSEYNSNPYAWLDSEFDFPKKQLMAYYWEKVDDVCVEPRFVGSICCGVLYNRWRAINNEISTAKAQLKVIGRVIDAIYVLENACFRTHESLARLATAISALDNFEQNAVKPILHSFNRGMIYSTPVYELIRRYHRVGYVPAGGIQTMSVEYDCTYKYELKHCDSGVLKQIKVLKGHLRECQAWADASAAWLDECISRQDFEPREVLDNFVAPEPIKAHFDFAMSEDERREVIALLAKKRAVIKCADYAKLADDEKERLDKIIVKAKEIQRLITGDFVKDGKFLEAKELINQAAVVPFFGSGPSLFGGLFFAQLFDKHNID